MENVLQNPSVQRVSAKLKELGINGEVHVLSDSARTAQEAADALGILVGQVASSIVFKLDDESPLLVITSGRHRVDTKLVAEKLGLPEDKVMTCFQSRLGKDPWIKPYTEDTIKELAKEGVKKVLVFSPAFVADCLETIVEVGEEYKEQFEELGGEHWDLVPSLNSSDTWVRCVENLILSRSESQEPRD